MIVIFLNLHEGSGFDQWDPVDNWPWTGALHRAELIGKQANVVAAFSLEALCGHPGVFDKGNYVIREPIS